jgi:hypothetical protein
MGLVPSAKGRIFNNILCVQYIHLTRPSIFLRQENVTQGLWLWGFSWGGDSGHEPQGAWCQDELIGSKLPVVKLLWHWSQFRYSYTQIKLALHNATTCKTLAMFGPTASNNLDVCGPVVATCIGNALKRQIQNICWAAAIAP